jgi:hypothetical protein
VKFNLHRGFRSVRALASTSSAGIAVTAPESSSRLRRCAASSQACSTPGSGGPSSSSTNARKRRVPPRMPSARDLRLCKRQRGVGVCMTRWRAKLFVNGRTTTTTTDPMEPSMAKPHTSASWQNPVPVCQRSLETLHSLNRGQGRNRTTDTRIFSPGPKIDQAIDLQEFTTFGSWNILGG